VLAALDMREGVARDGLPPAHIGLHAGPVLFQEGDYFGRTVNVAARIADYARRGEILVTDDVVAASGSLEGVAFFTEAIFLGIYLYGRERVSPGLHLFSGVMVAAFSIAAVSIRPSSVVAITSGLTRARAAARAATASTRRLI